MRGTRLAGPANRQKNRSECNHDEQQAWAAVGQRMLDPSCAHECLRWRVAQRCQQRTNQLTFACMRSDCMYIPCSPQCTTTCV